MRDACLTRLISDEVLDRAYEWPCRARRDYPASADIWNFRRNWTNARNLIKQAIATDRFRFGVLDRIVKLDGSEIELWTARDALVLKALSIVLGQVLPVSSRCTHIKGHGGSKAAVRQVQAGEWRDNGNRDTGGMGRGSTQLTDPQRRGRPEAKPTVRQRSGPTR